MKKLKKFFKKNWFYITITVLIILKQLLTAHIPLAAYTNAGADDVMMLRMAQNIRAGKWLGGYSSSILVKGAFFPMFLAITNFIGISYMQSITMLYSLASLYFVYCIKNLFKSKKSLLIIFIALLFNPVSFATWTYQRLYRNGLTLSQVLIIIGSMYKIYELKDSLNKKTILYSIIAGVTLATFWNTREDGIWLLPFVITVTIINLCYVLIKGKKNKFTKKVRDVLVVFLPIIILAILNLSVKCVNYYYYNVFIYNEINDGYFGKVIKATYSVKDLENIQYVTNSRKKIRKLYSVSPTLKSIEKELEASLDSWDYADRKPGDKQVEDGWFWWALKDAVNNAGYYKSAKTSNAFYKKVYNEIKQAQKEKKIGTQKTMPSNLMSPWKKGYAKELLFTVFKINKYVINYDEVVIDNKASYESDVSTINEFEAITNNKTIRGDNDIYVKYTKRYTDRATNVIKLYQTLGIIVFIISIVSVVLLVYIAIRKKKEDNIKNLLLLLLGIILSYVVLICGVSYNHITSCYSIYYMYLSGAYPLIISFEFIAITSLLENRKKLRNK